MIERNFLSETLVDRIDRILLDAYGANIRRLDDSIVLLLRDCKAEILSLRHKNNTNSGTMLREIIGDGTPKGLGGDNWLPEPGHISGWGKGKDE